MLNTWRQRRSKPGCVCFFLKALPELNQLTTWTNLKSRYTNKSRKWFKSLTKIKKANNYKSCGNQTVPQCLTGWMLINRHHKKETQLLEEKAQQKPEDSGGYKFTKDTFYSHSINKDPSQKKTNCLIKRKWVLLYLSWFGNHFVLYNSSKYGKNTLK